MGKIRATVKLRDIKKREQGFTITEMMVTLAILAIMTSIATPNYLLFMQSYRLRGAVSMVRGDLNKAKVLAIKSRRQYRVVFNTNSYQFWVGDRSSNSSTWTPSTVRSLSEYPNVTIITTAVTPTFNPRGTVTSGATIGLQNGKGDIQQVTVSITGRISLS